MKLLLGKHELASQNLQKSNVEYLTTKTELVLPTFKSWTVHKIIEYSTLRLLSSHWNIYHSTTAYFFDPPCILCRVRRKTTTTLRSASTLTLVIPSTRRTTLGDPAFPVTVARAWNALPSSVRSAPSLLQFRRDLKTALFQSSHSCTIVFSCVSVTDCNF